MSDGRVIGGRWGTAAGIAGEARLLPLDADVRRDAGSAGAFGAVHALSLLAALAIALALYVFTQALVVAGPTFFAIGVRARSALWVLLVLNIGLYAARRGASDLLAPIAPYLPFFFIGVVSTIVSVEPGAGARALTFWMLGALGASAAGRQLGEQLTVRALFWIFMIALAASVAVAIAAPAIGQNVDARSAGGAWRGIFVQKNGFAWYSCLALFAALTVTRIGWPIRVALVALAAVCIVKSASAGGVVQAVAVLGLVAMVTGMRRLPISPGIQAAAILVAGLIVICVTALLWDTMLSLIGRDATLTGRTVVWRLYLDRAFDSWFIGAGPGSFSGWTQTTADVGRRLSGYGLIATPHNLYIATFGEVGVLGLFARLLPDLFFVAVLPFARPGRGTLLLAAVVASTLLSGLGETHAVFGTSVAAFMTVLVYASIGREEGGARAVTPETPPAAPIDPPSPPDAPVRPIVLG